MFASIVVIGAGAILGAVLRWLIGELCNSLYPAIPPGTLIVNVAGGYIIGVAICVFAILPELSRLWRLFFITGFLGALTTFSTFTAEIGKLIQKDQYCQALLGIGLHVCGSLGAFFLGIGTVILFKRLFNA